MTAARRVGNAAPAPVPGRPYEAAPSGDTVLPVIYGLYLLCAELMPGGLGRQSLVSLCALISDIFYYSGRVGVLSVANAVRGTNCNMNNPTFRL